MKAVAKTLSALLSTLCVWRAERLHTIADRWRGWAKALHERAVK